MLKPRALLIDFGGTLDSPRHWLDRFVNHYRAAGVAIERDQLDPAYTYATEMGYRRWRELKEHGFDHLVEFLVGQQMGWLAESGRLEFLSAPGMNDAAGTEIARAICAGFVAESRAGMAQSREVLRDLSARYRIAVVSNFYGNLAAVLAEAGLAELVDAAVDSSSAGIFKPDTGIFMIALRALGVGPREAAMVGDSLDKDCAAARRLGLRTVWLCAAHRDAENPILEEVAPDYVIRTLGELRELAW